MSVDARTLKASLDASREAVLSRHAGGGDGFDICVGLAGAVDSLIVSAHGGLASAGADGIAVLALGGYGRRELFPGSDIDIMVLVPSGDAGGKTAASDLLHLLWDTGISIGHSVRTVDEAIDLHGVALDAWTSMLEGRFVAGNADLAGDLLARAASYQGTHPDTWFVSGILADLRHRLERYGQSVKLLEPNIKKSAGGLRDLHAAFWLHKGTGALPPARPGATAPALKEFADRLLERGSLDADQHAAALQAMRFLFKTRHEMHRLRGGQHDTLEYALQNEVARGLGIGDASGMRPVEVFMREYYRHARTVNRLSLHLCESFRELVEVGTRQAPGSGRVRGLLNLGPESLSLVSGVRRFSNPADIFEAFTQAAEIDVEPDFRLRGAIERSVDLLTPDLRSDPHLASCFRRILSSSRVSATLRDMSDLGVLGAYIPEWSDLVAFFQHNVYHYYTADEHTLIALANAEQLRGERGMLGEAYRLLRRRDILFMAILLHDIAKPRGIADHEITGVSMAHTILGRLGMEDALPEVSFLIRQHLSMEQIAFRRNIHDASTIRDFAARFDRPEWLDYLYVLTYADLSAVNQNVWTDWKAAMLQELYQRTSEVLRRRLAGDQIDRFHEERRAATEERIVGALQAEHPTEDIRRHLDGIQSEAYVSVFTEADISRHIRTALERRPVAALFNQAEGHTDITVIAHDAPYALSKFCAVLSANDATIFDANIFTRDDGIVIDRFRVSDAATSKRLESRVCAKIDDDLTGLVAGNLDIDHLFREHRRRWKRRPRAPSNPVTRTDVEFEDTPKYTIIDVYAADAVGFLYRVTETMSRLGLDIYFAKIATRIDGVVDAFYVLDRDGKPVLDAKRRESIREEILMTIQSMQEVELA